MIGSSGLGMLFKKTPLGVFFVPIDTHLNQFRRNKHIHSLISQGNIRNKCSFWEVNQEEIVKK